MRARAAAFLFSVTLLMVAACADGDLFNPNRNASTQLSLRPYFAVNGGASALVDVNQVRVTIRQLPGGEVVSREVIDVDPTATSYNLSLDVPANSNLRILIELLNTVGGVTTVQFSGEIEMSVTTGPQSTPPADIPVFPGGPENLSITALTISPRNQTILEGEQVSLHANVTGGPANPVVTWISLNSAVATVAANGTVLGVGPGTATITAQAGPRLDNVTVEVGARATAIDVSPIAPVATSFGSDITFSARVIDIRSNEVPGLTIGWSIADPAIATQMTPGVFRARRNGTTVVTATTTHGGRTITGTATLRVEQRPTTLVVTPASATLSSFGETRALVAQGKDAGGNDVDGLVFTWSSNAPDVATVDANGVVTARANGVAVITATGGGSSAEATITVAQRAVALEITPSEATLRSIRETVQLSAELKDALGNVITAPVIWASTLPGVASVDANGLVTATGDGVVVITARAAGANGSATIQVERVIAGVLIHPVAFELNAGSTLAMHAVAADANNHPIRDAAVTWSSSNPSVATVNASGIVSGVQAGEVDILASTGGVSAAAHGVIIGETVPGGPFNLLIVSNSSSDNTLVRNELLELMPHVTISMTTSVASLTPHYLSQFKVVMLSENGLTQNGPQIGNAIADYVQSGGNLVIGTFYWQNRSDNPRYPGNYGWGALEALDMFQAPPGMGEPEFSTKFEYRSAALDPASIVAHPLTAGVSTLNVQYYPNGMAAKPGTTVVASYTNGAPLIGFVTHSLGQRLVGIAAFPAHEAYGGITGDFWRIFTNALDWAAAGSTPAPVAPPSSVVTRPQMKVIPENPNTPKRGGTYDIR